MNPSIPSDQTPSEDVEPTSVAETVKSPFKKHRRNIIGGGTVLAVVAGSVFMSLAKGQDDTEDTDGSDSSPDPVTEDRKRQTPCEHQVSGYERMTKYGPQAVRPYSRGGSTA
ncbi:hypothetical protein ABZ467_30710 [Streptomyces sp. NPDC005727]|uniref:hypothetical protein n=1 Tax=unclassified Streptomyces TaxID=2593676 RepID=UPI0033F066E9